MPNDLSMYRWRSAYWQSANYYLPLTTHRNLPYNMAATDGVEFSDVTSSYVLQLRCTLGLFFTDSSTWRL